MTSWQLPTADEISAVAHLTAQPEEQRYFYTRLENPLWINALHDAGYLTAAPPESIDGAASYPPRPVAQYIARVAGIHPDPKYVAVVLGDLVETDDPLVQADLMRAMRALDPQLLRDLLPAVAGWVAAGVQSIFLSDRVGELVVHALHDPGNANSVRAILDAVFEPQWGRVGDPARASLRMGDWEVKTFADDVLAQLVDLDPLLLLDVLLRALAAVLDTKVPEPAVVVGAKDDHSAAWFPDLSGDEHLYEAEDLITYLVVRALDEIAALPDLADQRNVIAKLEDGGWVIHRRLALRFLARCDDAEAVSDEILDRLTDPSLAGAYQTRYDYEGLLRAVFPSATRDDQQRILAALELAADEKADLSDRWLFERLAGIADHLSGEWTERYQGYAERFGEPWDGPPVRSVTWEAVPDRSPLSPGDAHAMTADELAVFARDWVVPSDTHPFDRPTWRGLAKQVEGLASQRSLEFSSACQSYSDVNRTVVAGLLRGLKIAVSSGEELDWRSALELMNAVATKDETRDEGEYGGIDEDTSWSPAKLAALDLLQAGFGGQASPPPLGLRSEFWGTIELMAANGAARDHLDLDEVRDSVFYALNATRSQAVYTAVGYLMWLHRHDVAGAPTEVDTFIRRILNPEREPFIGMRAAVAHELPFLAYVDQHWAVELLPALFTDPNSSADHWLAAWNAYVCHAKPLPDAPLLRAMAGQYATAIEIMGAEHETPADGDPRVHLGMHLLFMLLNGVCELEHPNLVAFFEQAPADVRARVVQWVGQGASEAGLSEDWFSRAREFCEWRLRNVEDDDTELRELAWFVASGVFSAEWWSPHLPRALRSSVGAGNVLTPPDGMMAEVAGAAEDHPAMALEVLEIVVSENEYRWYEPYLVSADTILSEASEHDDLKGRVRVVADRLTRAGHEQFERFAPRQ